MFEYFNKFFKIFTKILWWVHFCWMSLQTEILATPLQYRTVEFMCEILSAVPPNQNKSGAAPDSHPVITISHDEVYWNFCIQFCSWIKFYSVIFCIFCVILYFTTFFKKIRFPRGKILEPPLINISLKLY